MRNRHPQRTLASRLFLRIESSATATLACSGLSRPLDLHGPEGEWRAIATDCPIATGAPASAAVFLMVERGALPLATSGPLLVRCRRDEWTPSGRMLRFDAVGPEGFTCAFSVAITGEGVAWYSGSGVPPVIAASPAWPDASLFQECCEARPSLEKIDRLLSLGANANAAGALPGSNGETASCLTALLCRPDGSDFADATARLLAAGADPNIATSVTQRTAALFAVAYDKMDSLRLLLTAGADPNALPWDPQFASPLRLAILASSHLKHKYLEALFAAGARFDLNDCIGMTPIHFAIARKDLASLRAMLLLGTRQSLDVVADSSGLTPLQAAVAVWGDLDAVRLLLAHGARPTAAGRHDLTALHTAAARAHTAAATLLVSAGCPVDARSVQGETPADLFCRLYGSIPREWFDILGFAGTP